MYKQEQTLEPTRSLRFFRLVNIGKKSLTWQTNISETFNVQLFQFVRQQILDKLEQFLFRQTTTQLLVCTYHAASIAISQSKTLLPCGYTLIFFVKRTKKIEPFFSLSDQALPNYCSQLISSLDSRDLFISLTVGSL